jgi:hypothetical protein
MFSFRPKRFPQSGYKHSHLPSAGSGPEMKVAMSSMVIPVSVIVSSRLILDTDSDRRYGAGAGEAVGRP